jgi:hypothetical protein
MVARCMEGCDAGNRTSAALRLRDNARAATPNDVLHLAPMASLREDVCSASTATTSTLALESTGRVIFSERSSKEARSPLELALSGAKKPVPGKLRRIYGARRATQGCLGRVGHPGR